MGQLRLLGEPPASDDHAALANLAFPQAGHTGFVAAAGLAGGQTIIGGTAAGESLSLQSTAHAARGVVQVIDALRLASGLIQDSGGNSRVALATVSPHLTLAGDLRVSPASGIMAHMALAPANPQSDTQLNAGGNLGSAAGTWRGLNVSPQLTVVSPYASTLHAVYGNGTLIVPSGASGITQGLNFTAIAAGQGAVTEMQALWVKLATSLSFTGTITKAAALHAPSPLFLGAKPIANYGLLVEPTGATGMTDAIGALIDAPANATNNYTIWAGAPITGTPRLRLDAGTPGTNQTLLWLAEGTSPTLRRVQWKQFQLLSALDKVMILV